MATNELTVFIVDDQPVFSLGLRTALEQVEDVTVLGESTLSDEAVELLSSFQPQVALVRIGDRRSDRAFRNIPTSDFGIAREVISIDRCRNVERSIRFDDGIDLNLILDQPLVCLFDRDRRTG